MKEIKAETPSKPIQMGRVTYRVLTDEEALKEFGTSFVFVGGAPKPPAKPAEAKPERVGDEKDQAQK